MSSSEFKMTDDNSTSGLGDLDANGEPRIDPTTGKKRRGRPPKPRPDGTVPPPKRRRVDDNGLPLPRGTNPIDPLTGKKKRGRPKKSETSEMTPPKEAKPRQSKKNKQANGFVKRESTDSDFYGNQAYSEGVSDGESKTPKPAVPPLPPFSPNFRRGSVGTDLGGSIGDDGEVEQQHKISHHHSPKRDHHQHQQQQMEACPPNGSPLQAHSHPLPPPSLPIDYGRSMLGMDSGGGMGDRSGSDSMDSEEELRRRRKYNRMCEYPPQQQATEAEQDLHMPHHHHHQQQQQQQQYHSPSRLVNYSPSPIAGKSSATAPSRTPTHSYSPGNGAYGYSNGGGGGSVHHPSASPYDRSSHSATSKSSTSTEDVATKSITGLESLVDQIPAAMSENESGVYSGSGAGSHPNTPRSVGPYSPAASQFHASPFHPSSAGSFVPPQNHFVPSTSDSFTSDHSSTNYSSGPSSGPTDFSVNSLVHNSSSSNSNSIATAVSEAAAVAAASLAAAASPHFSVSDSFSVSSLTSSYDMASKYSGLPSAAAGNPYMQPGNCIFC